MKRLKVKGGVIQMPCSGFGFFFYRYSKNSEFLCTRRVHDFVALMCIVLSFPIPFPTVLFVSGSEKEPRDGKIN